jgi:hypothetical protein
MAQELEVAAAEGAGAEPSERTAEDEDCGTWSEGTEEGTGFEDYEAGYEDGFYGEDCVDFAETDQQIN